MCDVIGDATGTDRGEIPNTTLLLMLVAAVVVVVVVEVAEAMLLWLLRSGNTATPQAHSGRSRAESTNERAPEDIASRPTCTANTDCRESKQNCRPHWSLMTVEGGQPYGWRQCFRCSWRGHRAAAALGLLALGLEQLRRSKDTPIRPCRSGQRNHRVCTCGNVGASVDHIYLSCSCVYWRLATPTGFRQHIFLQLRKKCSSPGSSCKVQLR